MIIMINMELDKNNIFQKIVNRKRKFIKKNLQF